MGAIALGVAAMVLFEGLVRGVVGAVQVHRAGYLANVQGLPLSLDLEDSEDLRNRMREVPGVVEVAPRISFGAMFALADPQRQPGFFIATAIDAASQKRNPPQ